MVPLMMARMDVMRLASRSRRRGAMRGMPPPTLASNMMSRPRAWASASSSGPALAISSLLAVTTCLPAAMARADVGAGRFFAADHFDDDVDGGVIDDGVDVGCEDACREVDRARFGEVADGGAADYEGCPDLPREVVAPFEECAGDTAPDDTEADEADANLLPPRISQRCPPPS